ncbi:putative transcriptional regulator [Variovorax sp. 1140]|uniref:ribbon-helix-helix domain-containing protein n=1 Tax=Variovorax atrisoli TaxID=3394203 RepID=UPI003395DD94
MGKSVRTTFSLPAEEHDELLKIAEIGHVSTAWVVREAVRRFLAERYPLLDESGKEFMMISPAKTLQRRR